MKRVYLDQPNQKYFVSNVNFNAVSNVDDKLNLRLNEKQKVIIIVTILLLMEGYPTKWTVHSTA